MDKKKRRGFWQWVKNIFKKRPLICTSIVSVLFAITYATFIEDGALSMLALTIPYILFIFWLFILTPYKFIKDKRPLSKKINIFNFIAWLIVVLGTIGLTLIGIVAYNGMANASKTAATKTIHAQTVKYISAEIQKCILGESSFMKDTLSCSNINSKNIIQATIDTTADKNPYQHQKLAVRSLNNYTNDEDVGFINLISESGGSDIMIISCNKTPCNKIANRLESIVSIK
jgi:type IV pilus assembly protein PilA